MNTFFIYLDPYNPNINAIIKANKLTFVGEVNNGVFLQDPKKHQYLISEWSPSKSCGLTGNKAYSKLLSSITIIKPSHKYTEEEKKIWKSKSATFYDNTCTSYAFIGIPTSAEKYNGKNLDHVYSIDIHSAFPAALARIMPITKPGITKLYLERHDKPENKEILNMSIGYMTRTDYCELRYKVLENHASHFGMLVEAFKAKGCEILNLRTDAIIFRYEGDPKKLETIEGYGNELGQWSWKFKDVTYRQFSTGKYQYMEDGIHQVVLNGQTKLDEVKPDRTT